MKPRGRPSNDLSVAVRNDVRERLRRASGVLPSLANDRGALTGYVARQIDELVREHSGLVVEVLFSFYSDELHRLGMHVTAGAIKGAHYAHQKLSEQQRLVTAATAEARRAEADLWLATAESFPRDVVEYFRNLAELAQIPWDERAQNSLSDLTRGADLNFVPPSSVPSTRDAAT